MGRVTKTAKTVPCRFAKFMQLPPEVRNMVYHFATPPRDVYIREKAESFTSFKSRFRSTWPQYKLTDAVVHYHWSEPMGGRYVFRVGYKKPDCKTYEFAKGQPGDVIREPWVLSESDSTKLSDKYMSKTHLDVAAWEVLGRSHLYSKAPIPTLLHTCNDSRLFLMRTLGYKLSFKTRTCAPLTWFSPKQDTLFTTGESEWPGHPAGKSFLAERAPFLGKFNLEELATLKQVAFIESPSPFEMINALWYMAKLRECTFIENDEFSIGSYGTKDPPQIPRDYVEESDTCEDMERRWRGDRTEADSSGFHPIIFREITGLEPQSLPESDEEN